MAYNLLDLRSRVRTKIHDSAYSADTIDGYINDAITEIADLYPWYYFQKLVSGSLTVGDYTYDQQSDHQITTKMVLIHPTDSNNFLDITDYRLPWQEFFDRFPAPGNFTNARPLYWTEYGNQIYFHCPVDLAYILNQFYQKTPTTLTDDTDVPELPINFRESIVLGASYRVEEERENYDIAMMQQERFNARNGLLTGRFANDTMTGPDTVVRPMGRAYDPWSDK